MKFTKKLGLAFAAGILVLSGMTVVEGRSAWKMPSLISEAQAKVGRPLTPVSVAGVARRTARRCANGTYNC
jgi:hypothetical protein